MTTAANNVLSAFNALNVEEQQQVATEILRRSTAAGDMTDQGFDEVATELFRNYDTEESAGAKS